MSESEIYAQLTKIFRDVFDNDELILAPSTAAADVDGWDSLNHINLVLAIESAFAIKFTTAQVEKMENVGDMVAVILQKH